MNNLEINAMLDGREFSIAYDEIHAAIHQLDYAANSADHNKALSYLENAWMLLIQAKTKIQNDKIKNYE